MIADDYSAIRARQRQLVPGSEFSVAPEVVKPLETRTFDIAEVYGMFALVGVLRVEDICRIEDLPAKR